MSPSCGRSGRISIRNIGQNRSHWVATYGRPLGLGRLRRRPPGGCRRDGMKGDVRRLTYRSNLPAVRTFWLLLRAVGGAIFMRLREALRPRRGWPRLRLHFAGKRWAVPAGLPSGSGCGHDERGAPVLPVGGHRAGRSGGRYRENRPAGPGRRRPMPVLTCLTLCRKPPGIAHLGPPGPFGEAFPGCSCWRWRGCSKPPPSASSRSTRWRSAPTRSSPARWSASPAR